MLYLGKTKKKPYQHVPCIFIIYVVKSEIIEDQNQKLEDEKKALQSQLEGQMQKLQELSGNVIYYEIQ